MKRQEFIRELERADCLLYRHGAKHDIYQNPANGKKAPVPRHTEINEAAGVPSLSKAGWGGRAGGRRHVVRR